MPSGTQVKRDELAITVERKDISSQIVLRCLASPSSMFSLQRPHWRRDYPPRCRPQGSGSQGSLTQPDILECEVKGALGSITMNKASGGDGIPRELFQILKDDAVKVLHSICQEIQKTQQWQQDWKRSVSIPIPKEGNAKECSNYGTIALVSHTSNIVANRRRDSGNSGRLYFLELQNHCRW